MATEQQDISTISTCLRKLVILAQIFGFFPVQGVYRSRQTFTYKSFRMIYAIFSICGPLILGAMQINKAARLKVEISQIDYVAAYISSAYVAIVFVDLARRWPHFMETWKSVERDMHDYSFPKHLNRQIRWLIGGFMTMFAVEYTLHEASRIYRAIECNSSDPAKAIQFFFGNLTLSHVFSYIPYNIPTSLVFQYWFFQSEFGFTYTDLFVMVISVCLASRLKQVTEKIQSASDKQITDILVWKKLREDYTRLEYLCQCANETISNIVMVSFVPNVFTILNQVYSSLKPKHNSVESVYFYVSLVFLVSRTAMVCLCGATVNEESRKPLSILNTVPDNVYNEEIEIFIEQLLNFEISLNGKRFFNIKRRLILQLAGAIVTYELVIIQFNQENLYSYSISGRCE